MEGCCTNTQRLKPCEIPDLSTLGMKPDKQSFLLKITGSGAFEVWIFWKNVFFVFACSIKKKLAFRRFLHQIWDLPS